MVKHKRLKLPTAHKEVQLQSYRIKDALRLFRLVSDNKSYLNEYAEATVRKLKSFDYVEHMIRNPDTSRIRMGIWQNEVLVGETSFTYHSDERSGEVGYWVGSEYTGKGIATAAVQALINYVFNNTPIITLLAYVDENNLASQKVLTKAGMRQTTGRVRGFIEFALNRPATLRP